MLWGPTMPLVDTAAQSGAAGGGGAGLVRTADSFRCGSRPLTDGTDAPTASECRLGLPLRIAYETSNGRPTHPHKSLIISQLRYFASGCGRTWNLTAFCSVPGPPSRCHAVLQTLVCAAVPS